MAASPLLERFDMYVYKRRIDPNPEAIVPAVATIEFYKQGATVVAGVTVPYTDPALLDPSNPDPPPATAVQVRHAGSIVATDIVQNGLTSSETLKIQSLDDPIWFEGSPAPVVTLWLYNISKQPSLTLAAGGRLLRLSDRPPVFPGPIVAEPAPLASIQSDTVTGRAGCYLHETRFDYTIVGAGVVPTLVVDAEASFVMR